MIFLVNLELFLFLMNSALKYNFLDKVFIFVNLLVYCLNRNFWASVINKM